MVAGDVKVVCGVLAAPGVVLDLGWSHVGLENVEPFPRCCLPTFGSLVGPWKVLREAGFWSFVCHHTITDVGYINFVLQLERDCAAAICS